MSNLQTQLSISLFVLVVFLIGLGAGATGTNWLNNRPPIGVREYRQSLGGPRPQRRPASSRFNNVFNERLVERLSSVFDLTDDQHDRLATLFDSQRESFLEMRREIGERFDLSRDKVRAMLSEILTAEQMQQFEAEFVRMRDSRPPRGPRPPRPPQR